MSRHLASLVVVFALVSAVPAAAQEKKIDINLGGGYTFGTGEVRNHLGDGFNVTFGVTYHLNESLGLQVEYGYNGLGSKTVEIPVATTPGGATTNTPFTASMNMQYVDFNVVFTPRTESQVHPYIVAGAGVYYRPVTVTTPGVGYVPPYCDPFWYICTPGGFVPVDNVVGARSTTGFGIDAGGGMSFKVTERASIYVEARWHYIWGPTYGASVQPTSVAGTTGKANAQFFPFTVGVRF